MKEYVDPTELQQWAMNLATQHLGEEDTHWDEYHGKDFDEGTNFPSGFKKVGCFSHGIHILTGLGQPSAWIFGSGKGGPCLIVQSASLPTPTNLTIIPWKPGIYFGDDEID
jgi:hypothetical protein